ncbi:MAG: hypothetical protein Q8Q36_01595 [bacterium]|nr:hypothetical protein [bacterium]
MGTIRFAVIAAVLLAVSGCGTLQVSEEAGNLPKPIKVGFAGVSLMPGVTLPDEDLAVMDKLSREAMKEQGGDCYVYTDQKETVDVLLSMTGTDTWRALLGTNLQLTLKGELLREKKEVFKLADMWAMPRWPSSAKAAALQIKSILCTGRQKLL